MIRVGLLGTIAFFVVNVAIGSFPSTLDVSAPYFAASLLGPLAVTALAVYGFRVALAGRPLFSE